MRKIYLTTFVVLAISLFLGSCGQAAIPIPISIPTATTDPVSLPSPRMVVLSPTPTPAPTSTLTPLPTTTPILFPMTIEAMRRGFYPGSPISIVEELDPGLNYRRYYAFYLSEGLRIYALLTIPNGEMPEGGWPGIVFNHGYIPPDVYRTTERYIAYVDQLASNGYVVFRIDYRGHDNSDGSASGAYGDPGYQVDVLNAIASLKKFDQVNPEKIGLWGHSMGGYLTLRAMVIDKSIKAGVIWAGVVGSYPDMLYNWRRTNSSFTPSPSSRSWRGAWTQQFGSPEENPDFWASVSANSYLGDLSGPLQLHHGTNDTDVPFAFSQTLESQIQAVGGTVESYLYQNDNHNLSGFFMMAMNRTVAFYDQYLKGESPD